VDHCQAAMINNEVSESSLAADANSTKTARTVEPKQYSCNGQYSRTTWANWQGKGKVYPYSTNIRERRRMLISVS